MLAFLLLSSYKRSTLQRSPAKRSLSTAPTKNASRPIRCWHACCEITSARTASAVRRLNHSWAPRAAAALQWLCRHAGRQRRGRCSVAPSTGRGRQELAATLLRARDEDRTTTEWPSDPDERLSVESGAPLWLCARWRRDLGRCSESRRVRVDEPRARDVTRPRRRLARSRRGVLGVRTERPPPDIGAPRALTLTEGRPPGGVWAQPGWEEALFEVQDAGSQAIVEACCEGFDSALDMCAGNGGKSIPLAARCQELWCHDVDTERLKRLRARARRAGVSVQCTDGTLPDATFDLVLVDALAAGRAFEAARPHDELDVADGDDEDDLAARRRRR